MFGAASISFDDYPKPFLGFGIFLAEIDPVFSNLSVLLITFVRVDWLIGFVLNAYKTFLGFY